ncbi:MAG: KdsC family phosphatase [Chitinophagaceae bacterium]
MNILPAFAGIKCFVFDVDGVLTDGSLYLIGNGIMARRMNIKDGYALQLAIKQGYHILVISGGDSIEVKDRLRKLGVNDVYMKVSDKVSVLSQCLANLNVTKEQVLFMGDDIPDYAAMQLAGLHCCPSDASVDIKQVAHYISPIAGGMGCVRDVIEKVLKLNQHWPLDTTIQAR